MPEFRQEGDRAGPAADVTLVGANARRSRTECTKAVADISSDVADHLWAEGGLQRCQNSGEREVTG